MLTRRTALRVAAIVAGVHGPTVFPVPSTDGGDSAGTGASVPVAAQSFTQDRKILAGDGEDFDGFGGAVALSGDGSTAIVGATGEDSGGSSAGAAYVFSPSGGAWSQEAKLVADDADSTDNFGTSVALSSDGATALVGAYRDEDPNGRSGGSAYVFGRSEGVWSQQAKLAAADGDTDDRFGWSVALSGDGTRALVGAYRDEMPNRNDSGSAYVFDRSGGVWSQQAKLAATDGDLDDAFGYAVALSSDGRTALIGASNDENGAGQEAGSAYVFVRSGGVWSQRAKLLADDGDEGDRFGEAVALSGGGTVALVGAYGDEDPHGLGMGSAYVFTGTGDRWSQTAKLLSDGEGTTDTFGRSVALSGNGALALVGAHRDQNGAGTDTGAAYVFTRSAGSWERTDRLLAADGSRVDSFGRTVALSADASTALLGATGDDTAGSAAGAAYLFTGPGTGGSPFEGAVPGSGGSAPPNDLDADGLYEDVDGDGRATFADAIALAFVDASALTPEQTAALDFDGDGDVDFADAIDLAFRV